MKKILSIFISLSLLLCVLASCADGMQESTTTDETSSTAAKELLFETAKPLPERAESKPDIFAEVDFGGAEFTFGIIDSVYYEDYNEVMGTDENLQDTLSRAVMLRNSTIEELYNCKIKTIVENSYSHPSPDLAEMKSVDISIKKYSFSSCANGRYYNAMNVVDTSAPWWKEFFIEDMEINGKLFGLIGNFSVNAFESVYAVFYDKELVKNKDLYSLVKSGEWTADTLLELARSAKQDFAKGSVTDLNGIVALYFGAGGEILHKYDGEDGNDRFSQALNETSSLAAQAIAEMFASENFSAAEKISDIDSAFFCTVLEDAQALTEAGINIGVLPMPAYSKEQIDAHGYISTVRNDFAYIVFPKMSDCDISVLGKFADIYAYYSSLYVYPAYVKDKVSEICGTQDDEMMIDHILKNIRFDWGFVKGVSAVNDTLFAGIAAGKNTVPELAAEKGEALSEAGELLITYIKEHGG